MSHVLKYSEWQSPTGQWHCNDVSDLGGQAGMWWIPAYLLGKTPSEYVEWLIDNYKPDHVHFNGKTFLYSWAKENYAKCHSFILYINKCARNKNFLV